VKSICIVNKVLAYVGLLVWPVFVRRQTVLLTVQSLMVTLCITKFNTGDSCILATQCICVFCMDLRTNSDYFRIQHFCGFCNRTKNVYFAVRVDSLNTVQLKSHSLNG
jgi:hypothetical protein